MAIASFADYVTKVGAPYQRIQDTKNSISTTTGRHSSTWAILPLSAVTPTTAVAPTSATTGAMGQVNSSGTQRIGQMAIGLANWGNVMICDRLSHQGGLSGIVTTAQTTNLPTAALTRYTSGVGVWIALEIYTAIGTTATTVTVSYTNSSGTAGRTTIATVIGGTGFRELARFIILPLQEGDIGVRSVESVTVLATTGTAGNFGVTLFKPLAMYPVPSLGSQQMLFDGATSNYCYMPEIVNDACLFYAIVAGTTATGVMQNAVRIIED